MLQFTKDDIMRAIEMGVMGILGFVVLLMVVRPLVRRVIAPEDRVAHRAAGGDDRRRRRRPAPNLPAAAAAGAEPAISAEPSMTAKMIDVAQIQGQVHAQSVQKVGDLADKNPNETVSIIRQWLNETSAAAA